MPVLPRPLADVREVVNISSIFLNNRTIYIFSTHVFCMPRRNGLYTRTTQITVSPTLHRPSGGRSYCWTDWEGLLAPDFLTVQLSLYRVLASLLQPASMKGVIYNVPLELSTKDIKSCYEYKISFVKRFQFKGQEGAMRNSGIVLLHFNLPVLPEEVPVGYPQFRVKQCISRPLRCFKCGYGAKNCKGKERCSSCRAEHNWKSWSCSNKNCKFVKATILQQIKSAHITKSNQIIKIITTPKLWRIYAKWRPWQSLNVRPF